MADPNDPRAHNSHGMQALAAGRAAEAAAAFARAAALDPGEPVLRINLAAAHRQAGNPAAEQEALEAALALDARHFLAHLRLGELLEGQGLLSKAAPHWSAVVQLAAGMSDRPPLVADALQRGQRFMEHHNAAFAAAVEQELGSDLASPDARRIRAAIDVMLGRRRVFQNECHGVHYPFLPADEFFERRHFPWFDELEARTPAIREEALALLANGNDAIRPYVRQPKGTPQNKWSPLDDNLAWGACFLWEYGTRNDPVCDACPQTAAALDRVPTSHVPGKAPSVFFSILQPGAHIPPHTGVTNTRAIIHLPLVVPDGCTFRVGGETRPWREGEAFAFDDTIEHEAWNPTDKVRIVLIFDVWNPHLTAAEQDQLARLFAVADRGLVAPRA
ncbi:aspartyl/asparaginyl beta-hydroxylase domain-containing protein [Sphingomonas humi]|uniref:Aspartyl/asparaginy/proline hydroxylase domain-containing protein n=1 Tax=Sphingomonas humi TaxID=335630 RepID=A0ABP7RHR9_9SPHN